ncbi:MAG: hypothetical protein WA902_07470 [Thermosynechococcaceae cyanobacterium]
MNNFDNHKTTFFGLSEPTVQEHTRQKSNDCSSSQLLRRTLVAALSTPFLMASLSSHPAHAGTLRSAPNTSEAALQQRVTTHQSEGVLVAGGFWGGIQKGWKTFNGIKTDIEKANERKAQQELRILSQEQRLRERQTREAERQRREAELSAARQAATAKQREEARQMRAAFDSMSPEEQQAYIYKLEERKRKKAEANLVMLGLAAEFFIGGLGSGGTVSESGQSTVHRPDKSNSAPPQPAPAPVKPIDPFYGGCHHVGC